MENTDLKNINFPEWEALSWYDFIGKIGLQSFNWAGTKSWDQMLAMIGVSGKIKILMIGCGVGTSSFYLGEKFNCEIVGIDLSEKSIEIARKKAIELKLNEKVLFQIADAHHLPFAENEFDAVFTEFMAYFLDHEIAIREFHRVLKLGGFVGFNELMLNPNIPSKPYKKIIYAGDLFKEISGYRLNIPKTTDYSNWCIQLKFNNILIEKTKSHLKFREYFQLLGGFSNFIKVMRLVIIFMRKSPIIREKFKIQAKVKNITMKRRKTAKYINPTILVAQK